ncbi:MAG: Holliday junction resolvase RuvX [Opitutae bacterium]|nr:Holliday junction resolvase RuvX [Opitutae bacterium]
MPTYLGIDYGTKRIGLALADELGIALPLGTIPGVDFTEWIEEMKKVVKDRRVDELVIGYPIHMDGVVGKRAKEVDTFISGLTENISLPVHRVDERLTSVAAAESIQRKPKGKRGKRPADGRIDATAASLILRDFLEGKGI